jgi:predicted unusual protein kinase regulating ubiquinone biosynthesis (AarF/ABC1/UbiB family)
LADDTKPPVGGNRFIKLAGMTVSVAGGYAKSRVKRLFQPGERAAEDRQLEMQRIGERIASTLGELKGAAMKMGQMASLAGDLLPKELAGALQSLQKAAPPVAFSVVEAQVQAEFDQPIARLFERFDPIPFASASIGQVHRARVDGREVICKVQYPGVDGAIDSDMRHLKLALLASGLLRVDKRVLDATFEEISARMHEELDYCNESDNVRAFRAFHQGDSFVQIPEVVGHRSAKRVLTLTYVPGDHVRELDSLGYTADERDRCATHLWRAIDSQIYDYGRIHADPNPANFAFRKDGTIVLYDFGCVKTLAPGIADGCRSLVAAALQEDYPGVERALIRLGVRRTSGPPVETEFYKRWRDWLALPILASDPFDFGTASFEREVMSTLAPDALKHINSFQPSSEMVFLNRAVVGLYAMLRQLRARVHVGALLRTRTPELAPWLPPSPAIPG